MIPTKLVLFLIGSYIGLQPAYLLSENVDVTVSPVQHKVHVHFSNLSTLNMGYEKVQKAKDEWQQISQNMIRNWYLDNLTHPHFTLDTVHAHRVDADLDFYYEDPKDLSEMGIYYNATADTFYIDNIPSFHMKVRNGNTTHQQIYFPGSAPFGFEIDVWSEMPDSLERKMLSVLDLPEF